MALETKIKTILTADANNFVSGIRRADSALKKASGNWDKSNRRTAQGFTALGMSAQALGGILAGFSFQQFAQSALQAAGELQAFSDRTSVSATTLSALQFSIQDAGGSLGGFAASLSLMQNKIGDLAKGTKSATEEFARIGLTMQDLQGLSTEGQFFLIAESVAKLGTEFERTEAMRNFFGRGAAALIPILNQTNGQIDEFVRKQEELGNALGEAQVARVDAFGDAISRMALNMRNDAINSIGGLLIYLDRLQSALDRVLPDIGTLRSEDISIARSKVGVLPEDAKRMQQESDYIKKAKQLGFATQIKRGSVGIDLRKEFEQKNRTITPKASPLPVALPRASGGVAKSVSSEAIKENTKVIAQNDRLVAQNETLRDLENERKQNIRDLGLTFESAFESAIIQGEKLGDVLRSLAQDMLKLATRKLVTEPVMGKVGGLLEGGLGGIFGGGLQQGGLARLLSTGNAGFVGALLPSFDVGTSYVPKDMVAQIHKGEMIVPFREAELMRNNAGGGNKYTFNVGTDVSKRDIILLQNMILATAGQGVIEKRVLNAQKRGQI